MLGIQDSAFRAKDARTQAADRHHAEMKVWAADQLRHQCHIDGTTGRVASLPHQLGKPLSALELKRVLVKLNPRILVEQHPYWPDTWTISVPRRLETPKLNAVTGIFERETKQYLCAFEGPVVPEFTLMGTHTIGVPTAKRNYRAGEPITRQEEIPWHVENPGWRSVLAKLVMSQTISTERADRAASKISIHSRGAWQALLGKTSRPLATM